MSSFLHDKQQVSAKHKHIIVHCVLAVGLLFGGFAYADEQQVGGEQTDAVSKFQEWLQQRSEKDEQQLQSSQAPAVSSNQPLNESGESQVSQDAFQQAVQQAMPMSTGQIKQYKKIVNDTLQAAASGTPKPSSSTIPVNMAPGAQPPSIRMYLGFITSLVFVDSTGAPWPVESLDLGNPKAFDIVWDNKSNVLMIQPLEAYTLANIAVRLEGLSTPVTLTLVPGQSTVDYRVDLRVNGLGPNAKSTNVGGSLPSQADTILLGVLDGISPSGSTQLELEGDAGQAWMLGDDMYVRTRFTILSPAWLDMMTSPDGTHAYKIQKIPSILLSEYGKPVSVKVKGV